MNSFICKNNNLISSRSNFTLIQQRIILFTMAQVKTFDPVGKIYHITYQKIATSKNANYKQNIRKNLLDLEGSTIMISDKDKQWGLQPFIKTVSTDLKDDCVSVEFHPGIISMIYNFQSCFTTYNLKDVINFRRKHSLKIYEICKQCLNLRHRVISLNAFRWILGVDENLSYLNTTILKKELLAPVIEEINKFSDISVSYKLTKQSSVYSHIKFFITANKKAKSQTKRPQKVKDKPINIINAIDKHQEVSEEQKKEIIGVMLNVKPRKSYLPKYEPGGNDKNFNGGNNQRYQKSYKPYNGPPPSKSPPPINNQIISMLTMLADSKTQIGEIKKMDDDMYKYDHGPRTKAPWMIKQEESVKQPISTANQGLQPGDMLEVDDGYGGKKMVKVPRYFIDMKIDYAEHLKIMSATRR